jgi:thiol-disulfide isomerase/thioredoxin
MKKLIVLVLLVSLSIFTITACDGTSIPTEGEGEGEGEGEEEVKQVVLVETYVADGCPSCAVVKPHLEKLAGEYSRDEMILVEVVPWGLYSIPESKPRYDWYSVFSGVPQVLFNGLASRLSGAQSYDAIKSRITGQLNATPTISIQATRTTTNGITVISGSIKNISENTLTNLAINGMAFRNRGSGFRYAVVDIFEEEKVTVSSLEAGATHSFSFSLEELDWDGFKLDGVIFVQSVNHPQKVIRQSVFID